MLGIQEALKGYWVLRARLFPGHHAIVVGVLGASRRSLCAYVCVCMYVYIYIYIYYSIHLFYSHMYICICTYIKVVTGSYCNK